MKRPMQIMIADYYKHNCVWAIHYRTLWICLALNLHVNNRFIGIGDE